MSCFEPPCIPAGRRVRRKNELVTAHSVKMTQVASIVRQLGSTLLSYGPLDKSSALESTALVGDVHAIIAGYPTTVVAQALVQIFGQVGSALQQQPSRERFALSARFAALQAQSSAWRRWCNVILSGRRQRIREHQQRAQAAQRMEGVRRMRQICQQHAERDASRTVWAWRSATRIAALQRLVQVRCGYLTAACEIRADRNPNRKQISRDGIRRAECESLQQKVSIHLWSCGVIWPLASGAREVAEEQAGIARALVRGCMLL